MKSAIEDYLDRLDRVTASKGEYFRTTTPNVLPPVFVISYKDIPESGCTTAFTFGLSSVEYARWKAEKPELIISVNSCDKAWAISAGYVAHKLRGKFPFASGNIIPFGQRMSAESEMTAFVVYRQLLLDESDAHLVLQDRSINFVQLFPIYDQEVPFVRKKGPLPLLKAFAERIYDVRRPRFQE